MRFQFTLNMPSSVGNLVHQVIGDHEAETLQQLLKTLEGNHFIVVRQWYVYRTNFGDDWRDKGYLIINTDHIGKVCSYGETTVDEHGGSGDSVPHRTRQTTAVRRHGPGV